MRLDLYLFENGYAKSRTEAKSLIEEGAVYVNERLVTKPSYDILPNSEYGIRLEGSARKYVSRGGLKLEGALREFGVFPTDRICLDIGASSGGFTDCLLQNGARRVYAVDTGVGQLAEKIRNDGRVFVLESFNARYMSRESFDEVPSLAVMDVSFISATYIIPAVYSTLADGGEFICLVKPQFEVGRANIGKGGIVKDEKARREALKRVIDSAVGIGFEYLSYTVSPIKGGDGNIEYLAYFKKNTLEG